MAKVVWKTTPKAAYEWVELSGGGSMSAAEQKAYLDEYIEDNGLVPVESDFDGDIPRHRYGRYKANGAPASALAPTSNGQDEADLADANAKIAELQAQLARANDQLGKKQDSGKGAAVVDGPGENDGSLTASSGGQTTEEARATLNQQDGVNVQPSSEEVRKDNTTADRSDNNPKVK